MSALTAKGRITLERYEQMVDAGTFGDRSPVELLDGELVEKMTQNPPHSVADDLCGAELARLVPIGWIIRPAKPIRLAGQDSKPEPDRCIARGQFRDYVAADPEPPNIALVVEFADASLDQDRSRKLTAYANAAIPVYWIINLIDSQVEVYTEPHSATYQSRAIFIPGQAFPVVINNIEVGQIAVADVLP